MLNNKFISIGIIILVIVAGAIFWSRNDSSTPDASVLEKGIKNLTRDSAAKKIEEYLQVNPPKTRNYYFNKQLGHYSINGEDEVKLVKALEAAGFTKIVEEKRNAWGLTYLSFDFTDQAKPYLFKPTYPADTKNIDVLLAKVISVEVTGITEANVRTANYTAKFESTPIGKIIDEKTASEERKSQMPFQLYDDGWRIGQ